MYRRLLSHGRRIRADRTCQEAASLFAVFDVARLVHLLQVVDAGVTDRALVHARVADRVHQRRIAAEAGAVNAHLAGVGEALVDRPANAVGDVVLDAFAPLAIGRALEVLAAFAGAAEVDLQYRITATGEELDVGVVSPGVGNAERAAVRHHDQRQLSLLAQRGGVKTVQRVAIAILELDRARRRHLGRVDPLHRLEKHGRRLGRAVEHVVRARMPVAGHEEQDLVAVLGEVDELDDLAGEKLHQAGVQLGELGGRVDVVDLRLAGGVHHREQRTFETGKLPVAYLHRFVAGDALARALGEVHPVDGGRFALVADAGDGVVVVGFEIGNEHGAAGQRFGHRRPCVGGVRTVAQDRFAVDVLGGIEADNAVSIRRGAAALGQDFDLLALARMRVHPVDGHARFRVACRPGHEAEKRLALGSVEAPHEVGPAFVLGAGADVSAILDVAPELRLVLAIRVRAPDVAVIGRRLQRSVVHALGQDHAVVVGPGGAEDGLAEIVELDLNGVVVTRQFHDGKRATILVGRADRDVLAGGRKRRTRVLHVAREGLGGDLVGRRGGLAAKREQAGEGDSVQMHGISGLA